MEKVNQKKASFRLNKGKLESEQELDLFKEYEQAINQIIVIRDAVIESACSLQDADQRIKADASRQDQLTERFEDKRRKFDVKLTLFSVFGGAIIGAILMFLIK